MVSRESTEVHQYGVGHRQKSPVRLPPHIVITKEFVHSEAHVGILLHVHLREPLLQRLRPIDETPEDLPVEEFEEFVRLDCRPDEVWSANQLYATDVAPLSRECAEEDLAPLSQCKGA